MTPDSGDSSVAKPGAPTTGQALLRWARTDRAAARAALRSLDSGALARACEELRPELRNEFLMLLEHPEDVVPQLVPAELCVTIRGGGMSEASWLLELATPEQRQACFDLDVWTGAELDFARTNEWIGALIEAGRPTLAAALTEIDPELWQLYLHRTAEVVIVGREDERPDGFFTEDGVVYFKALEEEHFAALKEIAQCAFSDAQPRYWQLVYGAFFELPSECEEYALRWRNARLADLGFPDFESAMRVYRPLSPEQAETLPASAWSDGALVERVVLPRPMQRTLLAETLEELSAQRAADVLGYVLGVANAIAVADGLRLSESESIPLAVKKAAAGIDAGLRAMARSRKQSAAQVLETASPLDLFRVGVTLEPELAARLVPRVDKSQDEDE